jgi:molybdenum cofactor biosynthesis enzyme MoaA
MLPVPNSHLFILPKEFHLAVHDNYHCPSADYMRISVTDPCSQRCIYCMPHGDIPLFEHTQIFQYEEILTIVRAAVKKGFPKLPFTSGGPLVRENICERIRVMLGIEDVEEVMLTADGAALLEISAPALAKAGLPRLKVSLERLTPRKFRGKTKSFNYYSVIRGSRTARKVAPNPLKINKVIDIKFPLRAGCDERRLIDLIQTAIGVKAEHRAPDPLGEPRVQSNMSRIGG